MARVTVEDCVLHVPNRFDLVMLAASRAKQIASGNPIMVDKDNDKDPVIALREIAEKKVDLTLLKEEVVHSFSRVQAPDTINEKVDAKTQEIEEAFAEAKHHVATAASDSEEEGDMEFGADDVATDD